MEPRQRPLLWKALGLAWEFGYSIAVPLVCFALLGRWLDGRLGTKPWLFLGGVLLAMLTTTVLLVRRFSRIVRDMNPPPPPISHD